MSFQFVNYFLDNFNTEQVNIEGESSIWNSAELYQNQNLNHSRAPPNLNHQENLQQNSNFMYWRPSRQLQSLQERFNNKILLQFPSVPCSFCSILMFPANAKWIQKEENIIYPLTLVFPDEQPVEHVNDSSKIAVCSTCKEPRLRRSPPNIIDTPPEIERVPIYHRRWLSPIHLSCSSGQAPNSNTYKLPNTFRKI